MTRKKKPERSFLIRVRETAIVEYVIDAADEESARAAFNRGAPLSGRHELETVDWEIERVSAND